MHLLKNLLFRPLKALTAIRCVQTQVSTGKLPFLPNVANVFQPHFICPLKPPISSPKNPLEIVIKVPTLNRIEDPSISGIEEIKTVGLIVIRRKKMKKHKLKKLRKKMKFEWAKRRQKRELKKEKLFQSELILQMKEADDFSAENYVREKLQKLKLNLEEKNAIVPKIQHWKPERNTN